MKIREGKPAGGASHASRARQLLDALKITAQRAPEPGTSQFLGLAQESLAGVLAELDAYRPECWQTSRFPFVKVLTSGLAPDLERAR